MSNSVKGVNLQADLYAAIRDVGDDSNAFAYLHSRDREQAYRDLTRLAVENGLPGRVQHMWLPLLREGLINLYDLGDALKFQIEDPLSDLNLSEQKLVDFVLGEFQRVYRINLRDDQLALKRIVDEAEDAVMAFEDGDTAEMRLPYLAATAEGPCHFCARLRQVGSAIEVQEMLPHVPKPRKFTTRTADPNEVLLDRLLADFKEAKGVDLSTDDAAMRRLRDAVKAACIDLKTHTRTEIKLPYITAELIETTHLHVWVTREMLGPALVLDPKPEPTPKPKPAKEFGNSKVLGWILTIVLIALGLLTMYLLDL